jgi:hypothetical protein
MTMVFYGLQPIHFTGDIGTAAFPETSENNLQLLANLEKIACGALYLAIFDIYLFIINLKVFDDISC